ncbi:arginine deiminase, partial [Dysosmobacter welbionis]
QGRQLEHRHQQHQDGGQDQDGIEVEVLRQGVADQVGASRIHLAAAMHQAGGGKQHQRHQCSGNSGVHHGPDVVIQGNPADTGGQVRGVGQRGHLVAEPGTADHRSNDQRYRDGSSGGHAHQGNAHGRHAAEGGSGELRRQPAEDEGQGHQDFRGDQLHAVVHQGRDRAAGHPDAHQHAHHDDDQKCRDAVGHHSQQRPFHIRPRDIQQERDYHGDQGRDEHGHSGVHAQVDERHQHGHDHQEGDHGESRSWGLPRLDCLCLIHSRFSLLDCTAARDRARGAAGVLRSAQQLPGQECQSRVHPGGPKRTGFESVLRAMDHQEFRPVSIDLLVPLRTVDGGRHVLIPVYQIHALGEFGRHGVRIQLQGILIEAQAHPQALVVCVALLLDVRHIHAAEHLVLHVVDHVRRR